VTAAQLLGGSRAPRIGSPCWWRLPADDRAGEGIDDERHVGEGAGEELDVGEVRDEQQARSRERAAKEFLHTADRINSRANAGSTPFDNNVITAAYVNATIGVGEAILAILQELRSRSKEVKKGSRSKEAKKSRAFRQDQDPRGSEGRNL
jgi:hypothetical protein